MAREREAPTALCKLCKNMRVLRLSHILPQCIHRRVINRYPDQGGKQVLLHDGVAMYSGEQYHEYMLCEVCEARFGKWEAYIAPLLLQADDRFPARDQLEGLGLPVGPAWLADATLLSCDSIARFAASVLWRANTSTGCDPRKVVLGKYASDIAYYLLDDGAKLPECARLFVELFKCVGTDRADATACLPFMHRLGVLRVHEFFCLGMRFLLFVGGALPAHLDDTCIARTQKVFLTDGAMHIDRLRGMVASSTRKGKLAEWIG